MALVKIKHPGAHCLWIRSVLPWGLTQKQRACSWLAYCSTKNEVGGKPLHVRHWLGAEPHLAKAACNSSSFLASCILSSAICAWSSAIWSLRSVESPSSLRRVFSNSCLCFSSLRRRSARKGRKRHGGSLNYLYKTKHYALVGHMDSLKEHHAHAHF